MRCLLVFVRWGQSAVRVATVWAVAAAPLAAADRPPDFNRDIRPILSHNCFACHGPDEHDRRGGLRLDDRDAAVAELDSGSRAIAPGHPEESELVARLHETDPDVVMPPPESNHVLTAPQKELLAKWIAAGVKLLIIDEPSVGIDIKTKAYLHDLIHELAESGTAVLLITSDLTEMVDVADRVAVMDDYRIEGMVENDRNYERVSTAIMALIHGRKAA